MAPIATVAANVRPKPTSFTEKAALVEDEEPEEEEEEVPVALVEPEVADPLADPEAVLLALALEEALGGAAARRGPTTSQLAAELVEVLPCS
jgi:hypothetical protein